MDKKEVLSKVDHTLLAQVATWGDIKQILEIGIKFFSPFFGNFLKKRQNFV